MTPAGAAIVAAAEILGCITATSLINPELYYFSTSIAGEMDMRTTQVCYCTPAAILTDAALHQLFRFHYGMVRQRRAGLRGSQDSRPASGVHEDLSANGVRLHGELAAGDRRVGQRRRFLAHPGDDRPGDERSDP